MVDLPHPIRTAKSSTFGPNQYCGGGPRGNLGCRMFFWARKKKFWRKKKLADKKKVEKKKIGEIFCEEPKFFVRSQILRPLPVPILGREKMTLHFFETFCEEPGQRLHKNSSPRPVQLSLVGHHHQIVPLNPPPPRTHLPVVKKKRKKTNRQTKAKSHAIVTTR